MKFLGAKLSLNSKLQTFILNLYLRTFGLVQSSSDFGHISTFYKQDPPKILKIQFCLRYGVNSGSGSG